MERLTKAAIATGGAAVLLLGTAGTLAFWTADGSATGTAISAGSLTVADGTCAAWTFAASDGGGPVTAIVPGDTVQSECTLTVGGTGEHLGISNIVVSDPVFSSPAGQELAGLLTVAPSSVTYNGTAVAITNPTTGALATPVEVTGAATPLVVTVTATFP